MEGSTATPEGQASRSDSSALAGGSLILVVAGLVNYAFRLFITWYLSSTLGAHDLGLYTFGANTAATVYAISALGLETGIILFIARFLVKGENERLKGAILESSLFVTGGGIVFSVAFFAAARWGPWWTRAPEHAMVLQSVALVVGLFTLISFFAGILRGYKKVVEYGVTSQIVLPGGLAVGAVLSQNLAPGLPSFLLVFNLAHVVTLAVVLFLAWRVVRPVLTDPSIKARFATRELLWVSVPMGVESLLYRLNQNTDSIMLSGLTTLEEVGIYKIATSLASSGGLLIWAVVTTFNPMIAELVYIKETRRLDALLKVVTRWMAYLILPLFLLIYLLPDLLVSIFAPEFSACIPPLFVLIIGQLLLTVFAPAARVVPMAGYSMINFLNGLAAFLVSVTLCWLLIPRYGMMGAAVSTSSALSVWTIGRLLTMWFLLRCNPFSARLFGILAYSIGAGLLATTLGHALPIPARVGLTLLVLLGFAAVVFLQRTPDDTVVVEKLLSRFKKLLGRRKLRAS